MNFLSKHSVASRINIVENNLLAIEEVQNPRLYELADVYGNGVVKDFITLQIDTTFERCGFDIVNKQDINDMIYETLISEHKRMRVNELKLFLHKFETGEYGNFMTRFNSQHFFSALKQFRDWEQKLFDEKKHIDDIARREEWARNAVPCPEHIRKSIKETLKKH